MLFKVLARLSRLGFPPKIINLVRVFHENVTLEVDLPVDDDGNTIIIKHDIGVKQGFFSRALRQPPGQSGSSPLWSGVSPVRC